MPHAMVRRVQTPCTHSFGAPLLARPIQAAASCSARLSERPPSEHRARSHTRVQAAKEAHVPAVTAAPETATWDPEGLLSRTPAAGGHFARRERKQSEQTGSAPSKLAPAYPPSGSSNAFKAQLRNHITRIPEQYAQQGIPASQQELYDHSALQHSLKQDYVSVDLQHPGMTVQCMEPPVLTIHSFMTADECQQLAQAAQATGLMQQSKIGEGNVQSSAASVNVRRTSSTVLLDPTVVEQHPHLQPMVVQLQSKAQRLLEIDTGAWTAPGQLPPPGQFCFESLQVACYQPGQHFLQHEDAFPPNFVKQNRFQRQATLLVYLNDVPTGGTTHFNRLDVSIQPECGKALLFFPAFADGTPDPRTVHTAQSPDSTKWVTQVWIAGGQPLSTPPPPQPSASGKASSSSSMRDRDDDLESRILSTRRKKAAKGKGKQSGSKVRKRFS
ncbi:hypothetical protein ABBQ38_012210 [Trebouxia sp. C0009 RCD-2024]